MTDVPVLLLASLDPVLRESATAALLCDVPGAVAVRHDLDGHSGALRRAVYDPARTLDTAVLQLDHGCLSCALREDVLPTVARLLDDPRPPAAIVLALPISSEPLPVIRGLESLADQRRGRGAPAVCAVCTVVDPQTLSEDLLGDDLLDERGLSLAADDRRAVGEALAHQLEVSDVAIRSAPLASTAATLLAHVAPGCLEQDGHALDVPALLALRRPRADRRGDLKVIRPGGAEDAHGVWTLDLDTWRPLHPDRLREGIELLGAGPVRGRGSFWLPTRPDIAAGWDGAGGQLSIGSLGCWGLTPPRTRLVVTGLEHDPEPLRIAFDRAQLTDAELTRGLDWWAGRPDGFDPWLGDTRMSA